MSDAIRRSDAIERSVQTRCQAELWTDGFRNGACVPKRCLSVMEHTSEAAWSQPEARRPQGSAEPSRGMTGGVALMVGRSSGGPLLAGRS